jgi:hypothetical protein
MIVFDKCKPKTYLQVLLGEHTIFRYGQLQLSDTLYSSLTYQEAAAMPFFPFPWMIFFVYD